MTEQPQHKPGDVVNGHILTNDGRWVPLHPAPSPKRGMSGGKKLLIILGVGFLLFAGCTALVIGGVLSGGQSAEEPATGPETTASTPADDSIPTSAGGSGRRTPVVTSRWGNRKGRT